MTRSPHFLVLTLALLLSFSVAVAQDGRDAQNDARALRSWIALDAPPGWEHLATDVILKSMPGWRRDALGNLILRKGSGSPRRVIACGLDRPDSRSRRSLRMVICDCVKWVVCECIRFGRSFMKDNESEC